MVTASSILLLAFAVLAPIDGVYLHLWRLRLHARAESRREHILHTARAVLFPAILWLLYAGSSSGWPLLLGTALVGMDLTVQAADMWVERVSRARLGGLSSFEYALHGVLITLASASAALILAARPPVAFRIGAEATLGASLGPLADFAVELLLPGALLIAGLHLYLCFHPVGALPARVTQGART